MADLVTVIDVTTDQYRIKEHGGNRLLQTFRGLFPQDGVTKVKAMLTQWW